MVEKLKCQLAPIKNIEEYDVNVLCANFGVFYQMCKFITPPSLTRYEHDEGVHNQAVVVTPYMIHHTPTGLLSVSFS